MIAVMAVEGNNPIDLTGLGFPTIYEQDEVLRASTYLVVLQYRDIAQATQTANLPGIGQRTIYGLAFNSSYFGARSLQYELIEVLHSSLKGLKGLIFNNLSSEMRKQQVVLEKTFELYSFAAMAIEAANSRNTNLQTLDDFVLSCSEMGVLGLKAPFSKLLRQN